MERNEIIISDLSACSPGRLLSRAVRYDLWNLVSYQTAQISGTAVYVGTYGGSPPSDDRLELGLPLQADGYYAIYLGLFDPHGPGRRPPGHMMEFKLSSESRWQRIGSDLPTKVFAVQEGFWRYADVTGQQLMMRLVPGRRAGIAWVRLVPVDPQQTEPEPPTKTVAAKFDLWQFCNPEGAARELARLEGTDFKLLFVTDDLDVLTVRSEIADSMLECLEDCIHNKRVSKQKIVEYGIDLNYLRELRDAGQDPLDVVGQAVGDSDMELHLGLRVGLWETSRVYRNIAFTSHFYLEHPQWRCRDRDGEHLPTLSYAFPQVRDYVLSIYRDVARKHLHAIDGLNVLFTRGPVFLLYEEPLVRGFQTATGQDPHELDPADEEWLKYRAGALTKFMRGLRTLCEELSQGRDQPLKLSANVFCSRKQNLRWGLDLATWVREGLVDILIPMGIAWPDPHDRLELDFFAELREISGERCKVIVQMPHSAANFAPSAALRTETDIARRVWQYYEAGMDGVYFWDTDTTGLATFALMSKLGHPEYVQQMAKHVEPSFLTRDSTGEYPLVTIAGDAEEGSGNPGGEYGWRNVAPTRTIPICRLDGDLVDRYWRDTGG